MFHELRLFADYRQIHVFDEALGGDLEEAWTEQTVADHLAIAEGAAGVGTTSDVDVAVSLEISGAEPPVATDEFDHVVEGAFEVVSGQVVVMGCTEADEGASRFGVPVGWTRIRVSRSHLDAVWRAGIDAGEDPATTERVLVQLWPGEPGPTVVHKRWIEPAA
jgi:hypothetical protein